MSLKTDPMKGNVLQYCNVNAGEQVSQLAGKVQIGAAGLSHPGRVVVGEDHRRSVELDATLERLAAVHVRAVMGAPARAHACMHERVHNCTR